MLLGMLAHWLRSFLKESLTLGTPVVLLLLAVETLKHGYGLTLDLLPFYAVPIFVVLALKSLWIARLQ